LTQQIHRRSAPNWLLYISLALNLLFILSIGAVGWHYRERLLQAFLTWRGKADIVFFGDSITAHGNWNSLLGSTHIKNSGIPGLGLVHLREEVDDKVLAYHPRLCVVMGGINDLTLLGRTAAQAISDYEAILQRLREANVKTVVQLTLYERETPATQVRIDSLNAWLTSYCAKNGLQMIDPNSWLSDQSGLQKGFAQDRTHLTQEAYHVWGKQLKRALADELR
jgi:lysophospholipase L1-like esterase